MTAQEHEYIVKTARKRFKRVIAVYLFGSLANNQSNAESDLDVALLSSDPILAEEAFELKTDLSQKFKRDVDLIDLRICDTVTAAQVISSGLLLFGEDSYECAVFETAALSAYALLNEERHGILEDIAKRGSIYG